MVDHGAANDEGVAKMHAWHRGKRIDIVTTHPNAGSIVVTNRVKEAVLFRK